MTFRLNYLNANGSIQPKKKFKALYLGLKALFYQGKTPQRFKIFGEELNKDLFSFAARLENGTLGLCRESFVLRFFL